MSTETKRKVYLAAQQGGASSEWYPLTFDTEQEALEGIETWRQSSYNGVGPIPVELDVATDQKMADTGAWGELLAAIGQLMSHASRTRY